MGITNIFRFAHLGAAAAGLPGVKPAAKGGPKAEDAETSRAEDTEEEESAEETDEEEAAEEEEQEEEQDEDTDEEQPSAARLAERRRCAAILSAPEAAGQVVLACHLAFNTGLSAAAAIGTLKATAPAATPAGGKGKLAAAMGAQRQPHLGAGGAAASTPEDAGREMVALMQKAGLVARRKEGGK